MLLRIMLLLSLKVMFIIGRLRMVAILVRCVDCVV